jgi:hypothetical protein
MSLPIHPEVDRLTSWCIPAATYSPRGLPPKYHRRKEA